MERVIFLVENLDLRISCMLNPESITINRSSGISSLSTLNSNQNSNVYNRNDRTWVEMELLFDTTIPNLTDIEKDVRLLTKHFYKMSERNNLDINGYRQPVVRMIWGKGWNQPGLISDIAERLDYFDNSGIPRRSWLKLRLLFIDEEIDRKKDDKILDEKEILREISYQSIRKSNNFKDDFKTSSSVLVNSRLDQLAAKLWGSPNSWKIIALYNKITDPLKDFRGKRLKVPNLTLLRRDYESK